LLEVEAEVTLDYVDKTYHDYYKNGDYKALQMVLEDTSVTFETTYHPKITLQLDRVSVEKYSQDRPIDDIVKEK